MPDRTDELNLPLAHQSGNRDVGHLSTLASSIESQQAGEFNEVLQNYYNENTNFNELRSQLTDLGYSDDRVNEISVSSHEERTFRVQNGHPSDLTPNQLVFLSHQTGLQLSHANIQTDQNGRQYIEDNRTREPDGTRARLFLPEPIQFNVLTAEQQEEVNYLADVRSSIYIEANSEDQRHADLTEEQRQALMTLATNYLNSEPEQREAERFELRNNAQQVRGLSGVNDVNNILFDFFVDIDAEYDYREANDGRPQNMTQEQYDFLRAQQGAFGYYGQPVLTDESGLFYFYGPRGKTPIPRDADINLLSEVPTFGDFDARPTPALNLEVDFASAEWLNGNITNEQFDQRIQEIVGYDPNDPARDPFKADLYATYMFELVLLQSDKEFRDLNDGRPAELSSLQYDFLLDHTLRPEEERYAGQPIRLNRGVPYFYTTNGNSMLVPTDDIIRQMIGNGAYTPIIEPIIDPNDVITDDDLRPVLPPLPQIPVLPSDEDIRDIASGQESFDPDDPLGVGNDLPPLPPVEPILPIMQDADGRLIIPEGILLPDELPSGEFNNNPFLNDYVGYVNDYQSLYVGMREMLRDYIVPSVFSVGGAIIGYGFGVARQRIFINSVYHDIEVQLSELDFGLNQIRETKEQVFDQLQENINTKDIEISLLQQEIIDRGQEQTEEGDNLLTELRRLQGLLAGTEDDPDIDPEDLEDLRQEIYGSFGTARQLAQSNQRLRSLQTELVSLEELTNDIEETMDLATEYSQELADATVTRTQINEHYSDVMNRYFRDILKVNQYRNEISAGFVFGNAIGTSLSLVITGYVMPTAITEELDVPIPPNIKIEALHEIKDKKKKDKLKYQNILKGRYDKLKETNTAYYNPNEENKVNYNVELEKQNLQLIEPKIINDMSVRILPKSEIPFRIIKDNGHKPLNYKEIQEYKSTLNQFELDRLSKNYLIFNDGGEVKLVKDHCKRAYQNQEEFVRPKIKIGYR